LCCAAHQQAIDAEKLEADVERCAIAIGKAARYFDTANLQNQSKIAADVKDSVAAFRPKASTAINCTTATSYYCSLPLLHSMACYMQL
jgi:hypothetical protein